MKCYITVTPIEIHNTFEYGIEYNLFRRLPICKDWNLVRICDFSDDLRRNSVSIVENTISKYPSRMRSDEESAKLFIQYNTLTQKDFRDIQDSILYIFMKSRSLEELLVLG